MMSDAPSHGDTFLEQSERFHKLVSELKEFVIVLLDLDAHFTTWHPAVKTCFDYTDQQFIGQPIDILFPLPDRLNGVPRREIEAALKEGRASDTRWLVKRNGDRVYADGITVTLYGADGRPTGFGKVIRDVTFRKNTEDSLRALTRTLDQSTVIVRRLDGVIEHWTAGCERLYGWTQREAAGQSTQSLLKTIYPEPLNRIEEQLKASGTWTGDLQHVRRDGTALHVAAHWVLLRDSEDDPVLVIETVTDTTERLAVQRELEASNERLHELARELERSNGELEEFARIVSHDLSAPLTSTRWLIDLLIRRQGVRLDETGRECLEQAFENLGSMTDLVDAVLVHAQVGRNSVISSDPVSSEQAMNAAVRNLERDFESSGASITHDELPHLSLELHALTQLFQNILSNAIKYRRPDIPVAIHVSATWNGTMWLLSVKDNGIGIEPKWFDRIFMPMQRLHGREIPGSGIGLATCKKIVERAGGRIWVESEIGSGSRFHSTLPGLPPKNSDTTPLVMPDHSSTRVN